MEPIIELIFSSSLFLAWLKSLEIKDCSVEFFNLFCKITNQNQLLCFLYDKFYVFDNKSAEPSHFDLGIVLTLYHFLNLLCLTVKPLSPFFHQKYNLFHLIVKPPPLFFLSKNEICFAWQLNLLFSSKVSKVWSVSLDS